MSRRGFTLIEVMLAVLLLALLTAGVTLKSSGLLSAGRAEDAVNLVRSFDAAARQWAVASGRPARMSFDLAAGTLSRLDGKSTTVVSLPPKLRIDHIKVGGRDETLGLVLIDVSPRGWSRSYALRLSGPGGERWLSIAGLSGVVTETSNERDLPEAPSTPGYDTH